MAMRISAFPEFKSSATWGVSFRMDDSMKRINNSTDNTTLFIVNGVVFDWIVEIGGKLRTEKCRAT